MNGGGRDRQTDQNKEIVITVGQEDRRGLLQKFGSNLKYSYHLC